MMTEEVLLQVVRISNRIWVKASYRNIELIKVCEMQHKIVLRMRHSLTIIGLAMSCAAFIVTQSILPFYQTEEKFDNFLFLADVSTNTWTRIWSPLVKEFTKLEPPGKLRRVISIKISKELKGKGTMYRAIWYQYCLLR